MTPSPDHAPEQDRALGSDLVTYAARLVRAVRQQLPQGTGARILSILDQHGALSVTALAGIDRCSQPTMSVAVRQLEEQGQVSRVAHPDDARSTLVHLTDGGRAELARVREANGRMVAERLAGSTEHTTEDLRAAVALLRDLLDAPASPTAPGGASR